ncbi:MAG: UbiD family decarboxylase domain-containing protein, partial [Planctomycetota bacterium]
TAPLPPGISELIFAGFLNEGSIPLVKCKTIDLHVPANAEFVLEGYVSTQGGPIDFDPRKEDSLKLDHRHEVFEGRSATTRGFTRCRIVTRCSMSAR